MGPTVFSCLPKTSSNLCTVSGGWGASCDVDPDAQECLLAGATSATNGCDDCKANTKCGYCKMAPNLGLCYPTGAGDECFGTWNPTSCDPNACETLSGLQYCTDFNGEATDNPWTVQATEKYFAASWLQVKAEVDSLAQKYNFHVCDACWDAYKKYVCASVVTPCGFTQCFANIAPEIGECATGTCASACPSVTNNTYILPEKCYQCYTNCVSQKLEPCSQYLMGKTACAQLVKICGCLDDATADQVCSYFPSNGRTVDLGSATCSGVQGWCSPKNQDKGFSLQATTTGQTCPNEYWCMTVPQSSGEAKVGSPVVENERVSAGNILSVQIWSLGVVLAVLAHYI